MKLKGKFEFVGIQNIQGKKDASKVYHNIVMMQDNNVVKVFADDKIIPLFNGIKKMDAIECELNINIGSERSYVGIESVRKLTA